MGQGQAANSTGAAPRRKFGWFAGVFTPSVLTILSAILFMRANFVVGETGVYGMLAIVALANAIAVLSALSVCAVSTNMQVRGGGAYFLISRVLGPEFGGAIGLVFFAAMALNVAFNVLGFTEALTSMYPGLAPLYLPIALTAALLLFGVAFIGADVSIKTQFVIMAFLVLSLAVMWGGALLSFDPARLREVLQPEYTEMAAGGAKYSFWVVFAIFFPSATGFLAGVNMSGDLAKPSRDIPRGTLAAVITGGVIYLVTMLLGAGAFPRAELALRPFEVLQEHALFGLGFLVAAGVFAATLSTALGSYLGAPRVLQAVARDKLIPWLKPFARGTGAADEPRAALWLTGVAAVGVLVWAVQVAGPSAFNIVASVISMVFLATYGMLNFAAFLEGATNNPSFRPRFKAFRWSLALAGFLGCLAAALLIDPLPALVAFALITLLVYYLRRRNLRVNFGDAWYGFAYASARNWLLRVRERDEGRGKNWRPTVLAFIDTASDRNALIDYGNWLEAGRGILQVVDILKGDPLQPSNAHLARREQLARLLAEQHIDGFPFVLVADDKPRGIAAALQAASIGPLLPNLALVGWPDDAAERCEILSYMRLAERVKMSSVLLKNGGPPPAGRGKRIDVWWRGQANGELMLLLAYLISLNYEWHGAGIRLLRVVAKDEGREPSRAALLELSAHARVPVEAEVITSSAPFPEILHEHSTSAALTVLGCDLPGPGEEDAWLVHFDEMLSGFSAALVVKSAGGMDLRA